MADKKFFRVRLSEKCPVNAKMVNGLTLTKQWQVKVGEVGDFARFPDVEAQVVVKKGNAFVPAEEASGGADEKADGSEDEDKGPAEPKGPPAATAGNSARESADAPDFASMTVEQLKNFLIAKGVTQNELRNAAKPELIEQAEFIWSQN